MSSVIPRFARGRRPGPRATLLLLAAGLELVALVLWPTVYLIDGSDGSTRIGTMFLVRYPVLGPLVNGLKTGVDWVFPGALWSWEGLGNTLFLSILAMYVLYAVAAWFLTRQQVGLRWIILPLLCLQVTLIFIPASMTTDIYNYAMYGEMPVLYGANPFVATPSEFPQSPLFYLIPLYWHDAPSVYGPLWVAISVAVATWFRGGALADELLVYRAIANLAHLANALLVWSIARRLDARRAPSAALAYAWNPLLLIDFALNGHNDVLMLTFTLAAMRLALVPRALGSAALLGLSIATKYTSLLAAPLLVLWSARQQPSWRRSIALVLGSGALMLVLLAGLYLPWVEGPGTFGPVLYWVTGPRLNNFWPEPLLVNVAAWISGPLRWSYEQAWDAVLGAFKLLAKAALAAYILNQAIVARRFEAVLAGSARISLVFLLVVNTWLMPWYYSWPLALAAALGWQSLLVRVCAAFTLTAALTMYQRQYSLSFVDPWGGITLVLPLLLVIIPNLALAVRERLGGHLPPTVAAPVPPPGPAPLQGA